MCSANFIKGMGIGLIVGSAIGMAACSGSGSSSKCCGRRKSIVGKALKTMGEVVDNIGDAFGL